MDYIAKNKIVTLLVLVLCITNIAVVVLMLNMFPNSPRFRDMSRRIDDRLALTNEQLDMIESLRQEHSEHLRELFGCTDELRKQMVGFAFDSDADPMQIEKVAAELGRINSEFELLQMENIRKIVKSLTSEQIDVLKDAMEEMESRGPGFMHFPWFGFDKPDNNGSGTDNSGRVPPSPSVGGEQGR